MPPTPRLACERNLHRDQKMADKRQRQTKKEEKKTQDLEREREREEKDRRKINVKMEKNVMQENTRTEIDKKIDLGIVNGADGERQRWTSRQRDDLTEK